MYRPESPEAILGKWAQTEADRLLMEAGYMILDAHLCGKDGASLFRGRDDALIAMDNVDIRGGKTVLRDTKAKTQSTFTRLTNREQHGIDARNFDHYMAQCKEGGLEGRVAIVELSREKTLEMQKGRQLVPSRKLLLYDLRDFGRRVSQIIASYGKGGMVYCDRSNFIEQYDLETGICEVRLRQITLEI